MLPKYAINHKVERKSFVFQLAKDFKYQFLLPVIPCFLKVSKQDGQKQIQHNDIAKEHNHNKEDRTKELSSLRAHAIIHDIVPAVTHQHLKDGDESLPKVVKVCSWHFSVWII